MEMRMKILGLTKGETTFGKQLRHGGSAILVDGEIVCALAEERVVGVKYASGFSASVDRVLRANELDLKDIHVIAVSTCCETERDALIGHEFAGDPRLVAVGHHQSHGAFAFSASGYDRALVVVIDGGGNVLSDRADPNWWRQPREQHSYYLATRRRGLELVARDLSAPLEVGFGEMYRAFTYFLGWHSSRHASRLMALAAHGRRELFKTDMYEIAAGQICSPIDNDPPRPVDMVLRLGDKLGIDFGEPRSPGEEILQIHRDVAAFVQDQLELTLLRRLRALKRTLHFDKLCLAGGVALNVLANGRLLREEICDEIYVPPAPADDGQCIGNAIVAGMNGAAVPTVKPITTSSAAALGPRVTVDSSAVSDALHRAGKIRYTVFENPNIPATVAGFLAGGAAVIVFHGRSEFGPRALGQRSIFSDPRNREIRPLFNGIKGREWFMPFAPTVLGERVGEWFEHEVSSPFMSFAVAVKEELRELIPAVVSTDGSARVQTVMSGEQSLIRDVIVQFEKLTGVPMVLNTSFNRGGMPIVETVDDAIATFADMAVNIMVLGRFIIVKNLSPQLAEMGILPAIYDINASVVQGQGRAELSLRGMPSRQIVRQVQQVTDAIVFVRHDFPLYGPYLEWLRAGRKVTTIRYRKGGVEVPKQAVLPLYETPDYRPVSDRKAPAASVRVHAIRYQRFGELTEEDAQRDGFNSLPEMLADFKHIYPKLREEDWVTIYRIRLVS